jgi:hypothetical protein
MHIHVEKDNLEAKFWLNPVVHVPTMMDMTPALCAN